VNVLVLMADEHARGALGVSGHPVIRTPHLDALAARGTRFTNAYCASPICVPSRSSFATGRFPHDIESWDNTFPYLGTPRSWAHRTAEAGYRTLSIGKLHYRAEEDNTGFPERRIPMHVVNGVGDLRGNLLREPQPLRRLARTKLVDVGAGESEYNRYDNAIAEQAVDFLRTEAGSSDEPWVAFVSFVAPHFPLIAPQEYIDMYPPESVILPKQYSLTDRPHHPVLDAMRAAFDVADEFDELTLRRAIGAYYALCTFMDDRVGMVLDALEAVGQTQDTLILYTSDHGDQIGEHGLWWKYTMYEGSAGVPLILAGPGVPVGKVIDVPVSLVDVYPTIVDALDLPAAPDESGLRGTSLLPFARGERSDVRPIFAEYHAMGSITGMFMLRDGDYKFVYYAGYDPQLFDLKNDPGEMIDLATDPAFAPIRARLEAKLREIADPDELDRRAKAAQAKLLAESGGADVVAALGDKFAYSPAPEQFRRPAAVPAGVS
jgi:choline-sulfatase